MRSGASGDGARAGLDARRAAEPLGVLNQMLGEGEVSIRIRGPREIRIQETVFAGVWRVQRLRRRRAACARDYLMAARSRAS